MNGVGCDATGAFLSLSTSSTGASWSGTPLKAKRHFTKFPRKGTGQ